MTPAEAFDDLVEAIAWELVTDGWLRPRGQRWADVELGALAYMRSGERRTADALEAIQRAYERLEALPCRQVLAGPGDIPPCGRASLSLAAVEPIGTGTGG